MSLFINEQPECVRHWDAAAISGREACEITGCAIAPFGVQGVYLLFSGTRVIYVGKSKNIFDRLHQHQYDKGGVRFTRAGVIQCDGIDLVEKALIAAFNPPRNQNGTSVSSARSIIRKWNLYAQSLLAAGIDADRIFSLLQQRTIRSLTTGESTA